MSPVLLRLLVAVGSGLALALAFEPLAWAFLAPLAVAGFVLSSAPVPPRRAWVPALGFGVAFYFVHIVWMTAVGVDAWIALAGLEALFYAVLGTVVSLLIRSAWWPLWVPAAWVAMEALRSSVPFSGMPWGRLAFAVIDTPVAPALPYLGSTGVSFLVALVGSLLAWVVVSAGRQRVMAILGLAGVCAASLLPAALPYRAAPTGTVTAAAVQGDVPGNGDDILLDYRQVTRNHVEATVTLADDISRGVETPVDFVVWPENSTAVDPFRDAETNAGIRAAVSAIDRPILVGAMVDAGPRHVKNQGIVWHPETGPGERYTKWHPVPYGEYIPMRSVFAGTFGRLALIPRDMVAGHRTTPLLIAGTLVADAICFDVAYDDGLYAQIRNGAQLVVVQTSNATFIHTSQIDQQFAISRVRALETGRFLVVAATNGVSGVVGPDGTVIEQAGIRTRAVLVQPVGLTDQVTPAVRIGAWSGRLCVVLTAALLIVPLTPGARRRGQARRTSYPQDLGEQPTDSDRPDPDAVPATAGQ